MGKTRALAAAALAAALAASGAGAAEIRDVAGVVGAGPNHLIGYGVVMGLKGTGDRGQAAQKAARRLLERVGFSLSSGELRSKNVALVMVASELPTFAEKSVKIDVTVTAIGDAESLQGGWLFTTPLHAADPEITYARAQGSITFGGAEKPAHPTTGRIPQGATVTRGVKTDFLKGDIFDLAVKRPGFALAQNIADAINNYVWRVGLEGRKVEDIAVAKSPGLVSITIPDWALDRPVAFIRQLLTYPVDVDLPAMVVVNERTGDVAVNAAVRVSPAAVSHGDLYVEIPRAAAAAEAEPGPGMPSGRAHLMPVDQGVTLQEVTSQLNQMRVTPRDLIAVLEKLIRVGALNAELIVE